MGSFLLCNCASTVVFPASCAVLNLLVQALLQGLLLIGIPGLRWQQVYLSVCLQLKFSLSTGNLTSLLKDAPCAVPSSALHLAM